MLGLRSLRACSNARKVLPRAALSTLTIGLIPADGIGCEVIPCARRVLEAVEQTPVAGADAAASPKFRFLNLDAGFDYFQKHGNALPDATVDSLKKHCQGALFGSVSSPSHKVAGYTSPIVKLRKELDLYANIRPIASVGGDGNKNVDMVIVRENTECLYVKQEKMTTLPDGSRKAVAERVITERASQRVGRVAFKLALQRSKERQARGQTPQSNQPPKVTIVHKSNVLSVTDGLFREVVRAVRDEDPAWKDVVIEEQLVDSMVYRMFREPHIFDVVVAPNLYGDIISDGAAALVGSLGLVPSANMGDTFVIGEPVHGSAPDIAGQGKANPIASIRSAAFLLEHLSLPGPALRIYKAVDRVLSEGRVLTPDLGGTATTENVTQAVIKYL